MEKQCSKCRLVKPHELFSLNKRSHDGFNNWCKECYKEYYYANASKINNQAKARRLTNLQPYTEYRRQYDKEREKGVTGKLRSMLRSSRKRAKEKGLEHTLKLEDLQGLMVSHCPIRLKKLSWEDSGTQLRQYDPDAPSLDRIDSAKGYIQGNVQIISHQANTWKNSMTLEQARMIVRYIEAHCDCGDED
jgi:hypothetical protein